MIFWFYNEKRYSEVFGLLEIVAQPTFHCNKNASPPTHFIQAREPRHPKPKIHPKILRKRKIPSPGHIRNTTGSGISPE
jgi:hypothetical protein